MTYIGALRLVTFPLSMLFVALSFRQPAEVVAELHVKELEARLEIAR